MSSRSSSSSSSPSDLTTGELSSDSSALIRFPMDPPGKRGLMSLLEANRGSPRGDP